MALQPVKPISPFELGLLPGAGSITLPGVPSFRLPNWSDLEEQFRKAKQGGYGPGGPAGLAGQETIDLCGQLNEKFGIDCRKIFINLAFIGVGLMVVYVGFTTLAAVGVITVAPYASVIPHPAAQAVAKVGGAAKRVNERIKARRKK